MTDFVIPKTRYARSGELSIAFQVAGSGPIDITLVNGSISHLELVYELPNVVKNVQRFARFARVIGFDKRGQGLSDRVPGAPSLEERMDDVRAVLDAVGSRRTVLLGFSEGCPMSLLFAATHPDRVSHLVLIGGFMRAGHSIPADQFEAVAEKVMADWGSGQMMRQVAGIATPTEAQLAVFGNSRCDRFGCRRRPEVCGARLLRSQRRSGNLGLVRRGPMSRMHMLRARPLLARRGAPQCLLPEHDPNSTMEAAVSLGYQRQILARAATRRLSLGSGQDRSLQSSIEAFDWRVFYAFSSTGRLAGLSLRRL
ncbi:alpha/beta fold hydrolase [Bradyrhizobium sp. CCBAU 11357]|uniref:alpha/beta fold hydrolase n=1 Tax=Bradyrhizobium sp. CCBAU 11357 TaxID=1630808 RepID=UPI003FA4867D